MLPKNKYLLGVISTALVAISAHASAAWGLNLPGGATDSSLQAYDLNMLITIICVVIGAIVYGVLIWSLINYRKTNTNKAAPFHKNTTVEIIWTIIPILILVAMVIPSIHGVA